MRSAPRRWRSRSRCRGRRLRRSRRRVRQERRTAAPAERRSQPDCGDARASFDRADDRPRAGRSCARRRICRRCRPRPIRAVIRARRLRTRYFPEELFADPAWDMLLDLLQAEIAHLRVPVSSLCIAAAVPATTALRWLKTMVQQGLFIRRADPHDGRRVFVELAPQTSNALRRYFAEVGKVGGHLGRLLRSALGVARPPHGRLAQLVEHLVYTERVGGSSPSPPTTTSHRPWRSTTPARRLPGQVRALQTPHQFGRHRDPWRVGDDLLRRAGAWREQLELVVRRGRSGGRRGTGPQVVGSARRG